MSLKTSEFSDIFTNNLQYLDSIFHSYGKKSSFSGSIVTLKCFEDTLSIQNQVSNPGKGKVLIIDGGASETFSLFNETLCLHAVKNKWEGIIINGYLRNSEKIKALEIGIKALGECIKSSGQKNIGEKNVEIELAGSRIREDDFVIADEDGIVIFEKKLLLEVKPKF